MRERGTVPMPTRRSSLATLVCAVLTVVAAWASTGPTRAADLGDFALEVMIGQMIMVGFVGTRPGDPWPGKLVDQIEAGHVGGILFLKRNVADRDLVQALNAGFLAAGGAKPAPPAA